MIVFLAGAYCQSLYRIMLLEKRNFHNSGHVCLAEGSASVSSSATSATGTASANTTIVSKMKLFFQGERSAPSGAAQRSSSTAQEKAKESRR